MTGESHVRDCMSLMHALTCETCPHCQVMAYGVKFVPSIIRGPYKLARTSLDVTNEEGYWSSNHVFRATNLPLQIVGLKIKAIVCNIRFCIAGEMAFQFF